MGYTLSIGIQHLGVKLDKWLDSLFSKSDSYPIPSGGYHMLPKQNKNDEQIVAMAAIVTKLCK